MDHDVVRLVLLTEKLEVAAQNGTLSSRDIAMICESASALLDAVAARDAKLDPSQSLIPF